jgi:hypothetical protein
MAYADGYITVPSDGIYYVYAQLLYGVVDGQQYNMFDIMVNRQSGSAYALTRSQNNGNYHSLYIGRLLNLRKGDQLSVKTSATYYIYYNYDHSFFGAFRLS